MSPNRVGMTLLELLVALLAGSLAVATASALLSAITESATRVAASARSLDSQVLSIGLLRGLLRRVDVAHGAAAFQGTRGSALFNSWCDAAGGWQERCQVRLETVPFAGGFTLKLSTGGSEVVIAAGRSHIQIRYLQSAALGGTWTSQWGSLTSAPLALLLTMDGDSVIAPIGVRY
jgi:Tfp pilus assembly protein PilW